MKIVKLSIPDAARQEFQTEVLNSYFVLLYFCTYFVLYSFLCCGAVRILISLGSGKKWVPELEKFFVLTLWEIPKILLKICLLRVTGCYTTTGSFWVVFVTWNRDKKFTKYIFVVTGSGTMAGFGTTTVNTYLTRTSSFMFTTLRVIHFSFTL